MSALHFVGQVDFKSTPRGDGYRAEARASCLKLDDGYLTKPTTFVAESTGDDERETIASAIEDAARAAMAWCERENAGGLLQ